MDCQIIFYMSLKTGYCEKAVRKKLSYSEFNVAAVSSAATVRDLGKCLADAVNKYDLIVIVGGLSKSGNDNIVQVLSHAFSRSNANLNIKKMLNPNINGDNGYILESGEQIILVLPDEPGSLEPMLSNSLIKYISTFFNVNYSRPEKKPELEPLIEIKEDGILSTAHEQMITPKDKSKKSRSYTWLYVLAAIAAIITVGVIICDIVILKLI